VNHHFIFEFSGKTAPNHDVDRVKNNLARMFAISQSEWDVVFSGKAQFVKTELDEATATIYFNQFRNAGAMGVIHKQPVVDDKDFGEDEEIDEREDEEELLRSARYFKIGTFLFVLVFTVDSFFQHFFFDIGEIFYLFPLACFAVASYHDVRVRGYSGWIGAVAGATIFALPLIQFLPNKNRSNTQISVLRGAISVVIAILLGYFVLGKVASGGQLSAYQQQASNMFNRWGEYPKGSVKEEDELKRHIDIMKAFLASGMEISKASNLRKRQQRDLAQLMHASNGRFFKWLNYQRFLYFKQRQEIPNLLSNKNLENLKKELLAIYRDYYVTYKYFVGEYDFYLSNQLSNEVHNISIAYSYKLTDPELAKRNPPGILKTDKRLFNDLKNPEEGVYEIYVSNKLDSIARGKYLAFATIILPKEKRYDRPMPQTLVIGGSVPEFDMGSVSMFQNYGLPLQQNDAIRLLLE